MAAVALVFKAAGVLPKMCGHMTALPAHFTADNSRHFLCLHAKHTRFHLTQPTAPLSSMCRRRGIFVSAVQAQETELSGEETAVSDWEGDGESVVMDEVAGWDEAEADSLVIDEESLAKLFVGNLPYDLDSEMLAQLFQQAGDVEIAEVIYNRETDQSRGFGFVTMKSVEEAQNATEKLNGLNVEGKMLTVKKAAPKGSRQETRGSDKIYVGNLPWSVDEARLREVFSEYGKVVDSKVVYDRESRRSRGFGFLTMSSKQEMDNAIASLDGQNLDGRTIRVNAAEEKPRRGSF